MAQDGTGASSISTGNSSSNSARAEFTNKRESCIHVLSDDVLLEIFCHFLDGSNFKQDILPLQYLLSKVCRRWKELVDNTPTLWTRIQLTADPPFDPVLYFERSKSALIDVCLDLTSSWCTGGTISAQVSEAIVAQLPRIYSLTIRAWEPDEMPSLFRPWKDQEPVNLITLNITTMRGTPPTVLGNPSESPYTNGSFIDTRTVKHLKLEGFSFQGISPLTSLTSLVLDRVNTGVEAFRKLLDDSPSLTSLVIRQFDIPIRTGDNLEIFGSKLDARCLRSLAINIDNNHTSDCECFLPFLSAKNLEYLEIIYLWPTLTTHHRAIMSQLKDYPNLRKLRIRSNCIWTEDVKFLSFLPASTNLEIVDFPNTTENSSLPYILSLTNLESITFDLHSANKTATSLNLQHFSDMVQENPPTLKCPVYIWSDSQPELLSIHPLQQMLGEMLNLLPPSTEKGRLDDYVNRQIFDPEFDMWQGDSDFGDLEDNYDNDDFDDDYGGVYDDYDFENSDAEIGRDYNDGGWEEYDRDEIEYDESYV